MKPKIVFVERKFWESVSLEKVFAQIDKSIPKDKFETSFVEVVLADHVKNARVAFQTCRVERYPFK